MKALYRPCLFFGNYYTAIQKHIENLDERLNIRDLAVAKPYPDAPKEHWFIGVEVAGNQWTATDLKDNMTTARVWYRAFTDNAPGFFHVPLRYLTEFDETWYTKFPANMDLYI